jgi:alkaline phosphatase D
LLKNDYFAAFSNRTVLVGVWDDHDYGINDGGRYVADQVSRQDLFISFLSKRNEYEHLRAQQGLYHSRDVVAKAASGQQFLLKILMLDTRSFRDSHFIPSVGQYRFPLSAIIASGIRGLCGVLGIGANYKGELLGEAQWRWLETELRNSASLAAADAHIIVSSIQVLTSNPVFESWGHFPSEKKRLIELLKATNPRGLSFLSGDVHIGELSQALLTRADGSLTRWIEYTSSGLTHSCRDGLLNSVLSPILMRMFSSHRISPSSYFLGKNFGKVSILPEKVPEGSASEQKWSMAFDIFSLEEGASADDVNEEKPVLSWHQTLPAHSDSSPIVLVDYAEFPVLPAKVQLGLLVVIFYVLLYVYPGPRFYRRKSQAKYEPQNKKLR